MATQKAMDMDTTLERPDRREVLRSYVAQLLAQNNRLSTADIAALAQTLRGLSDADKSGNVGRIGANVVKGMEETKAPELPTLKPLIGEKDRVTIDSGKAVDEAFKGVEKSLEDYTKSREKKSEQAQKDKDSAESSKNNKAQQLAAAQAARNQFLTGTMNIHIAPGSNGLLSYTEHGTHRPMQQSEIDQILANAEAANLVPALPK